MRGEHALDLRSARASLDPVDDALALDEDERRHGLDQETLGKLRPLLDVDAHHAESAALLSRKMREEALHAPRRAGPFGPEKDQRRLGVVSQAVSPPGWLGGEGTNSSFPCKPAAQTTLGYRWVAGTGSVSAQG